MDPDERRDCSGCFTPLTHFQTAIGRVLCGDCLPPIDLPLTARPEMDDA